ncbi:MAG: hypothetical protein JW829_03935 [Pirellulales bacterium]|nr:hypothetical protein [Pirellulales bacterium]
MLPDKRDRRPPRNFLARSEQWRLLALVFLLGFVLFVMGQIRSPEARQMLSRLFGLAAEDGTAESDDRSETAIDAESSIDDEEIASLLTAAQTENLPPDTFLVPADSDSMPGGDPEPGGPFPGIDTVAMDMITDNAPFRDRENRAWFNMIAVLKATDPEAITAASAGPITYAQLIRQPYLYRGRVITVRGEVRRVVEKEAPKNELGIETYHQLWIKPAGGGNRPLTVYCLELPDRFPRGGDVNETIRLDGLFFKNWSYPRQTGLGLAPALLARQLEWIQPEASSEKADVRPLDGFWKTAAVAAVIASGLIWLIIRRTSGRSIRSVAIFFLFASHVLLPEYSARDARGGEADRASRASSAPDNPRRLFELAGIGASYFAMVRDGRPLVEDELELVRKLLYRIRSFSPSYVARWTIQSFDPFALAAAPDDARSHFFLIRGTARDLSAIVPPQEVMDRYQTDVYYEVLMDLEASDFQAVVVTPRIPDAWQEQTNLVEPCSAAALFLKSNGEVYGRKQLVFLANRMHWHPDGKSQIRVNGGQAILGALGVDIGLFDRIHQETPLGVDDSLDPSESADREPFYQILWACGRLGVEQTIRAAERNLSHYADHWAAKVRELEMLANSGSEAERILPKQIAAEVIKQANEGLYSVAPIFRDARHQVGELFAFNGIARRAIEIPVGRDSRGKKSDVLERFGIERYFEVELFTRDSQNLPLVFCVRELPDGFPIGETIHEEIRVAGFFLKKWRYQSRRMDRDANRDGLHAAIQFAPLLIGRSVLWIVPEAKHSPVAGVVAGGLFILAIGVIWFVMWRCARRDREFYRRMIAMKYEDDLN